MEVPFVQLVTIVQPSHQLQLCVQSAFILMQSVCNLLMNAINVKMVCIAQQQLWLMLE